MDERNLRLILKKTEIAMIFRWFLDDVTEKVKDILLRIALNNGSVRCWKGMQNQV